MILKKSYQKKYMFLHIDVFEMFMFKIMICFPQAPDFSDSIFDSADIGAFPGTQSPGRMKDFVQALTSPKVLSSTKPRYYLLP